jgi:hypothetical protein
MHFIREAGYGIWPVLFFGIAALIVAARQAASPTPGRTVTALWLMALSFVFGLLATLMGVQASASGLPGITPDERWIFFLGLEEALYNLVTALMLSAMAMLLLLFAHLRSKPLARAVTAPQSARDEGLQRAMV